MLIHSEYISNDRSILLHFIETCSIEASDVSTSTPDCQIKIQSFHKPQIEHHFPS